MERSTPSGARTDYRPHLDGLRTFAVVSVMAFHAGITVLSGGFIGVDVFFVLSGYLVTGVLVSGIVNNGTVGFGRFYARRIRRLLPLALVVLIATAVTFRLLASPLAVTEARGSFAAAFLYFANWWFISESTEYIGSNIEASPILHFWSLSIEEQFYFIWPIVLFGAWHVARRVSQRPFRTIAIGAGVLALASLIAAMSLGARNLDRAYYGTDTRAYQLLLGAIVALVPGVTGSSIAGRTARWAAPAGVIALLVLTTDVVALSPIVRGAWAAAATAVIIVAVEASLLPALNTALSWRPLVMLGTRSYAMYLWHLPVLFVLASEFEMGPWASFAVTAVMSMVLSELSARLLEGPIRHAKPLDAIPRPVIATGLALSLGAGLLISPVLLSPSTTSTVILSSDESAVSRVDPASSDSDETTPTTTASTSPTNATVEVTFDWEAVRTDRAERLECGIADLTQCLAVAGSDHHVLLIGDSHALVWQSAFVPAAEAAGVTLSVASVPRCSWHMGAVVAMAAEFQDECLAAQQEVFDSVVPALEPDVVVLVHRAVFDPGRVFLANADRFLDATDQTVERVLETAEEVVIIEPTPLTEPEHDPLGCLADGGSVDDCAFDANSDPTTLELRYRELAAQSEAVTSIDFDLLACPELPRCNPIVGQDAVWRDHSHMTATYAARLSDAIAAADFMQP